MARGKKYKKLMDKKIVDAVSLQEAIKSVKATSYSKFTGTIELHLETKLPKDVDPKSIKGSLSLPHSIGYTSTVAVFTGEENQKKATAAGADMVGLEDLVKKVQKGEADFDVAIATPDVMPKIAMLGKELGPKGLMPNPKLGTVTEDFEKAVKEFKAGKMNFKADGQGNVHMGVAKVDMDDAQITENINAALEAIAEAVGKSVNNVVKKAVLSPTMGMSVKFELSKEA